MNNNKILENDIYQQIISLAKPIIEKNADPAHDIYHALRVLDNAIIIANVEGGDFDIIVPAAILHDCVQYKKNDPRSSQSAYESSVVAKNVLDGIELFPKEKISLVQTVICEHSYSKNLIPSSIEAKIIQDADKLEASGAITIMRVFASAGVMNKPFYCLDDPFCEKRAPDFHHYSLDLFYSRLLNIEERLHTQIARDMIKDRAPFLHLFLEQLKKELPEKQLFI